MTISGICAEAVKQVRNILPSLPGRDCSIPNKWYYTPFISLLRENTQPFHPRREGTPGTETIFQHTLKDLSVLHCFLMNDPGKIKINEITFPPVNMADPMHALQRIVETARATFSLPEMYGQPGRARILDVFALYHDIGKRTESRRDHESAGAEKFLAASWYFCRFLTESEIQAVYLLTKYHGVYGQIDAARRTGQATPNYDGFVNEMAERGLSFADKVFLVRSLFLFNVVEGLQSDVYSEEFYSTDKFEDILRCFEMVNSRC